MTSQVLCCDNNVKMCHEHVITIWFQLWLLNTCDIKILLENPPLHVSRKAHWKCVIVNGIALTNTDSSALFGHRSFRFMDHYTMCRMILFMRNLLIDSPIS